MTRKVWNKLKEGSLIKSIKSGRVRKVIKAEGYGCIRLILISSSTWRRNFVKIGVDTTTYCDCDKWMFKVYRY